jgi:hypothetical protein
VTKPIYPLHHIIDNHLFAVLFDLFCYIASFQPADHRVKSEPMENFQDLEFEDLEQPAGFEGKCPCACCTYFLYLSIGLHAGSCLFGGNTDVSYPSAYYPCYPGFGVEY